MLLAIRAWLLDWIAGEDFTVFRTDELIEALNETDAACDALLILDGEDEPLATFTLDRTIN